MFLSFDPFWELVTGLEWWKGKRVFRVVAVMSSGRQFNLTEARGAAGSITPKRFRPRFAISDALM